MIRHQIGIGACEACANEDVTLYSSAHGSRSLCLACFEAELCIVCKAKPKWAHSALCASCGNEGG